MSVKNKECYLCASRSLVKRQGAVRDHTRLKILECKKCGLVFLSSFEHINERFYRDSKMHTANKEIGAWLAEASQDDQRRYHMLKGLIKDRSLLDFGCGAGGFLQRAQKIAKDVQGVEPEDRLKGYFQKKRIRVAPTLDAVTGQFDIITLFHVLEHVPDPVSVLSELKRRLKAKGRIIVEVPNANDALLSMYRSEAFSKFTYWSCHLFLFTVATLRKVAYRAGLKIDFMRQVQRYPLSNHLYWLSVGKPGGHKIWEFLDDKKLNDVYAKKLSEINACDTIVASCSIKR